MYISFLEKRKAEHYHNSVTNNNSFLFFNDQPTDVVYILPETTSFSVRYRGSAGIGAHYVYPSSGREILSRLDFHGAALIPCLRSPHGTLIIMDPACCTRTYFYRD